METATSFINGVQVALATMGPREDEQGKFFGLNIYVGEALYVNARQGDVLNIGNQQWRVDRLAPAEPPRKGTVFFAPVAHPIERKREE